MTEFGDVWWTVGFDDLFFSSFNLTHRVRVTDIAVLHLSMLTPHAEFMFQANQHSNKYPEKYSHGILKVFLVKPMEDRSGCEVSQQSKAG